MISWLYRKYKARGLKKVVNKATVAQVYYVNALRTKIIKLHKIHRTDIEALSFLSLCNRASPAVKQRATEAVDFFLMYKKEDSYNWGFV